MFLKNHLKLIIKNKFNTTKTNYYKYSYYKTSVKIYNNANF